MKISFRISEGGKSFIGHVIMAYRFRLTLRSLLPPIVLVILDDTKRIDPEVLYVKGTGDCVCVLKSL
jgi:hypothetical protein